MFCSCENADMRGKSITSHCKHFHVNRCAVFRSVIFGAGQEYSSLCIYKFVREEL